MEQVKEISPKLIVSFNYKYIVTDDVIDYMEGNIVNLHTSYLPWNRGANPNFWSFVEDTPKGVTIHQINAGLDTGKILYQKECFFDKKEETFVSTYEKLNHTIIELFKEHWNEIWEKKYSLKEQKGKGTYHTIRDLEKIKLEVPFEWNGNITEFLKRYKNKQEEFVEID